VHSEANERWLFDVHSRWHACDIWNLDSSVTMKTFCEIWSMMLRSRSHSV
jgi:hypothetical protein